MGASISVKWTDGPTESQAKVIAGSYAGASFDPSIDLKSYHTSELTYEDAPELDGQAVHFGADYVFVDRKLSADLAGRIREQLIAERGSQFTEVPPIRESYGDWRLDWEHPAMLETAGAVYEDLGYFFGQIAKEATLTTLKLRQTLVDWDALTDAQRHEATKAAASAADPAAGIESQIETNQ